MDMEKSQVALYSFVSTLETIDIWNVATVYFCILRKISGENRNNWILTYFNFNFG
jgi:hypothetical protein